MLGKYFSKKFWRGAIVKFLRRKESPERISLAVAIGLFIGFAIPVGGQIPFVIVLCILFRIKKLIPVGIVFTFITNPWTAPILYPMIAYFGSYLLGEPLSFRYIDKSLRELIGKFDLETFLELGWDILLPFLLGSLFLAFVSGIIGYFSAYGLITSYRRRNERRIVKKVSVSAEE